MGKLGAPTYLFCSILNSLFGWHPLTSDMSDLEVMYANEETELGVAEKVIIFLTWLIVETIGNGMLFGLIYFDICAGDPLKRRISDQVDWYFLIGMKAYKNVFQKSTFIAFINLLCHRDW